ncbi:MAG: hypothetical protein J6X11_07580 [Treponema sp.]|nr:hypothetical protein [Treponema sp.]
MKIGGNSMSIIIKKILTSFMLLISMLEFFGQSSSKTLSKDKILSNGKTITKNCDAPNYSTKKAVYSAIYDTANKSYTSYAEFTTDYGYEKDFISYFSDWINTNGTETFLSYADSRYKEELYREQLAKAYKKACLKFGIGTVLVATMRFASIAIPGGQVFNVPLISIAESTYAGATSGTTISASFSLISAILEGKTGDELFIETLDNAGNGCIIGALFGFADSFTSTYYPNTYQTSDKFQSTLDVITETGNAPKGFKGGKIFKNREEILPKFDSHGNPILYKEWDVNLKIPGKNRGAERLITGYNNEGKIISTYKTEDHYRSFTPMK